MKSLLNTISLITLLCFLFCCKVKNNEKPQSQTVTETSSQPKTGTGISISLAYELNFRRSYADAQFMHDEKEIERYYRHQKKRNPFMGYGKYDTAIRKRFEELGMVKGEELLQHVFKKTTNSYFQFDDQTGKKIYVFFKGGGYADQNPGIIGHDSCQIMFWPTGDLRYILKDIIPGGNKEIVVLKENYFMNGDNFDLQVYEIMRK